MNENIHLRKVNRADAAYMLEWMKDDDIQKCFKKQMGDYTLDDVYEFCEQNSGEVNMANGKDIHFAITNELNEYLGTISLKNLNLNEKSAEYAIVLRRKYQGFGIAEKATKDLIEKAFGEFGLIFIYLYVLEKNIKAIKLYEKCGFEYCDLLINDVLISDHYENQRLYKLHNINSNWL